MDLDTNASFLAFFCALLQTSEIHVRAKEGRNKINLAFCFFVN